MIGTRRVLAVIPARGGSKGVPGKNIRPVGGRPLIAWTVMAALASRYIDRVIVSSDDDGIIAASVAEGAEAPFRRAPALSTDDASSIDVVLDVLDRCPGFEIVVLLQPTSPLRTAEDIDAALDTMLAHDASSCVSVCAARDHPWLVFSQGDDGVLAGFCSPPEGASLRRQDLPAAYVLNGAIYAAACSWVASGRRLFAAGETRAYVMPVERSDDIDTWDDLRRVDEILSTKSS